MKESKVTRGLQNFALPIINDNRFSVNSDGLTGYTDIFIGTTDRNKVDEIKKMMLSEIQKLPEHTYSIAFDFKNGTEIDSRSWTTEDNLMIFKNEQSHEKPE